MSSPSWTPEQILLLAPDASSAKAGKGLAAARQWVTLGANEQTLWGECKGSAKDPYQTQIDLTGPAFKCTCPSRKFPCKHALGLFLLFANQSGQFSQHEPPAWVSEWLAKRAQQAEARSKPKKVETDPATAVQAQARRTAKREENVREGLEDLALWLQDLVRQGLATVQGKPASFWETPAARLVDAQAPGLARRVRELASTPATGDGWQGRLLEHLALLHLAVEAYTRLDTLPADIQADVRTVIGWTQDQDELLQQNGIRDTWIVLGKRVTEEMLDPGTRASLLKVQRTWLWGTQTQRAALILHFAAPGQMLDASLIPGTSFDAELVYFPGACSQRALVKRQVSAPPPGATMLGYVDLSTAYGAYANALAANPWLETFPLALTAAWPVETSGDQWDVRDRAGRVLPLAKAFPAPWQLLALSGGHPLGLFGEWDGRAFWPLTAFVDERWIFLGV